MTTSFDTLTTTDFSRQLFERLSQLDQATTSTLDARSYEVDDRLLNTEPMFGQDGASATGLTRIIGGAPHANPAALDLSSGILSPNGLPGELPGAMAAATAAQGRLSGAGEHSGGDTGGAAASQLANATITNAAAGTNAVQQALHDSSRGANGSNGGSGGNGGDTQILESLRGASGKDGDGSKGDAGKDGAGGVGKDGSHGHDGYDGRDPRDGKDGYGHDGRDGRDGRDGADGRDGRDGHNGTNGNNGSNGHGCDDHGGPHTGPGGPGHGHGGHGHGGGHNSGGDCIHDSQGNLITQVIDHTADAIRTVWNGVDNSVTQLLVNLDRNTTHLIDGVNDAVTTIGGAVTTIGDTVATIGDTVDHSMTSIGTTIGTISDNTLTTLDTVIDHSLTNVGAVVDNSVTNLAENLNQTVGSLNGPVDHTVAVIDTTLNVTVPGMIDTVVGHAVLPTIDVPDVQAPVLPNVGSVIEPVVTTLADAVHTSTPAVEPLVVDLTLNADHDHNTALGSLSVSAAHEPLLDLSTAHIVDPVLDHAVDPALHHVGADLSQAIHQAPDLGAAIHNLPVVDVTVAFNDVSGSGSISSGEAYQAVRTTLSDFLHDAPAATTGALHDTGATPLVSAQLTGAVASNPVMANVLHDTQATAFGGDTNDGLHSETMLTLTPAHADGQISELALSTIGGQHDTPDSSHAGVELGQAMHVAVGVSDSSWLASAAGAHGLAATAVAEPIHADVGQFAHHWL